MARGGINKALVKAARDRLVSQGEHPSIDAVRIELGNTGSKTTIHRYLRELDEEEGARLDDRDLLSDTLSEMVGRLAKQLHEEANTLVKRSEDAFQKDLEAARTRVAELEASLASAEVSSKAIAEELDRANGRIERLNDELVTVTTQRAEAVRTIDGLEDRLAEKDERITSLEEKHRHARESLEHFRESARTQREEDQRRTDHQVQLLQTEIRSLKETLVAKQEEASVLNKANAELITKLSQSQHEARQGQSQAKDHQLTINKLSAENARLENELGQKTTTIDTLGVKVDALGDALKESEIRFAEKERETIALEAQVATQQVMFDQIKQQMASNSRAEKSD